MYNNKGLARISYPNLADQKVGRYKRSRLKRGFDLHEVKQGVAWTHA